MTLVIPFLNEGIEVEETIKSIKSHTTIPFDIILINDASTDGYNYGQIAQMYAVYITSIKQELVLHH